MATAIVLYSTPPNVTVKDRRDSMSLRALRNELRSLISATEDSSARLAELDAKARPYTLNPNGSV
jgi:hypothetical protein